eukprot:TRINITY_DN2490_c0_g1_i1.p1 TRINITY_DN2490_c0_g1~~TRINITY_DN2490_c0_g1_i1.p1  ORF type:complete len:137 (-),score=12.56 TRINITY_DN2490_c0_g1_i1:90-500(-)
MFFVLFLDRGSSQNQEADDIQEEDRVSTVKCECANHQNFYRCVHAALVLWFLLSIKQDAIIRSVLRYRMLFANTPLLSPSVQSLGLPPVGIPNALVSDNDRPLDFGHINYSSDIYSEKSWPPRSASLSESPARTFF